MITAQKLGGRIVAAFDRGHEEEGRALLSEMYKIAFGQTEGYGDRARGAAWDWLFDNDGGVLAEATLQVARMHPEILVEAVKDLRAVAQNQGAPRRARMEARQLLKAGGFDDESLSRDDGERE